LLMAEPEEILLDGAHHATRFVQRLWRSHVQQDQPQLLYLADCRARLEVFIQAAFGISMTVGAADPPEAPSWLRRWALRIPRHLIRNEVIAETNGTHLRLAASVEQEAGATSGWAYYRLCAAQAAARAQRGTPEWLPSDLLERDLYLIREAEIVDQILSTELPGMTTELCAERQAALRKRPVASLLTPQEAATEALILAILRADIRGTLSVNATPRQLSGPSAGSDVG
jgi:nitric oxide reductase NorD protein